MVNIIEHFAFRDLKMYQLEYWKKAERKQSDIESINSFSDHANSIFWFVLIGQFVFGAYYTCSVQWNRFVAHPTVISLERDYRSWNATLPGITLCYAGRLNATRADQQILTRWNVSADHEEYEYFRRFLEIIVLGTVDEVNDMDLTDYEDDARLEDTDFRELIVAVSVKPYCWAYFIPFLNITIIAN